MDTGTHSQRLTYPISPEYVSGWTSERAISELVANARDDDPDFTFSYADGVLSIEDKGPGVPEEGLVLGWSSKRGDDSDRFIGVHGEGLKIASLVLARDPTIGKVMIETVGYGFIPEVATNQMLVPLGGRRATTGGSELLAYEFFECERERGTKVSIECSAELAEAVRTRFRFLTDSNYQAPQGRGTVIDESGGRIYIGGVLVSENPRLMFSYDIPLSVAKQHQNRDRTIIEGHHLEYWIRSALADLDDEEMIERWVEGAFKAKLHRSEQSFHGHTQNPAQARVMHALGKKLFAGRKVTWADGREDEEAVLDLRDRGYEVLRAKGLDGYGEGALFTALGVKKASTLYRRPQATRRRTLWIARKDLTVDEMEILDRAVKMVRGAYGLDAVDKCDVYERTYLEGVDADLRWGGFYEPRGGRIGLQRQNLESLEATLDVLVHEAAHRLRHREGAYDYGDRTRGFEWQLGQMAARALAIADEAQAIPEVEVLQKESDERERVHARHPAMMMRALISERVQATGLSFSDLAGECGVSSSCLKQMRSGRYRSHANGSRQPDGVPQLKRTQAVTERLGLEWSVVHLTLLSENVWRPPFMCSYRKRMVASGLQRRGRSRARDGEGRIMGVRGDEIQMCIERLHEIGIASEIIEIIQNQLDHAFDGGDGKWLEPYRTLVRTHALKPTRPRTRQVSRTGRARKHVSRKRELVRS